MARGEIIMVRHARFVPVLLVVVALGTGLAGAAWWFLAIPFVAVGWWGASPNLNLADGSPAYLAMLAGLVLLKFHGPSGAAVVAGAAAGFYLSALEMRVTAKPYRPEGPPEAARRKRDGR